MKYDCLKNLIGIKTDCETIEGQSHFFVNQIPGIDIPTSNGVTSGDYKNGVDMLKGLLEFAYDIVGDEVLKSLDGSFRFNDILNQSTFCFFNNTFAGTYAGNRGVRIKRRYSNVYTAARIPVIRVCIEADATISLVFTESNGKTKTYSDIALKAKTPTDIYLDYEFTADYLDITMDTTAVSPADCGCTSGCSSCSSFQSYRYDDYTEVFGLTDGIENSEKVFGIVPTVQIICSQDQLVCSIRKQIELLALYKFAGLFFQEAAISKRSNRYTSYTREDSKDRAFYYDNPIGDDGLYQQEMKKVLSSLRGFFSTTSELCFICSDAHYGHILP